MRAAQAFLREHGCKQVGCNGYAPYYIFPGVDHEYAEAHPFLRAHGFTVSTEAVMRCLASARRVFVLVAAIPYSLTMVPSFSPRTMRLSMPFCLRL